MAAVATVAMTATTAVSIITVHLRHPLFLDYVNINIETVGYFGNAL